MKQTKYHGTRVLNEETVYNIFETQVWNSGISGRVIVTKVWVKRNEDVREIKIHNKCL